MTHRNEAPIAVLKDSTGHSIVLQSVSVRGQLTETLASIQVEQCYRNPHQHNIEAVYTFPLPMGAVLLDMEVEIADQKLASQVVEKKAAEQRYEEAIIEGNSAVMVQALGNGLYSMNVGNLLANESAVIRYRYALPLSWQGDQLRLTIPTTVAPRYGDAATSGLEPWQTPASSLMAEYPFALTVSIEGKLADAEISSPTHPVSTTRIERGLEVTLNRQATLDRDFVLAAKATVGIENSCLVVNDGEHMVALATLRIPPVIEADRSPLCLKIVIDCSGSMAGMSISQARKAALAMLDLLKPEDSFNVTLFGDAHEHLFDRLVPATANSVELARKRLNRLDANLGGTETGKALAAVYKLGGGAGSSLLDRIKGRANPESRSQPMVLLITDGEVWNTKAIIDQAVKSGHRIFTVGVGLSVAESFVATLAKATGAACELVSPQEGMADKVLAQFHRLQQPMFGQADVLWDVTPTWQTPIPTVLFAGDTIHVYAGFENEAPASVRLNMPNSSIDTSAVSAFAVPVDLPDISRLAAHARIGVIEDESEQTRLAVSYQLLTERTSFLVVAERQEKADNLPTLHQVPQMMAAGCGGTGVDYAASANMSLQMEIPAVVRRSSPRLLDALECSGVDRYDIPAFLRRDRKDISGKGAAVTSAITTPLTPVAFIESMNTALAGLVNVDALPTSLSALKDYGLPSDILDALAAPMMTGRPEKELVSIFLYALTESCLTEYFQRGLKRLIVKNWKRLPSDQQILQWCADCMRAMEADAWNWREAAPLPAALIAE